MKKYTMIILAIACTVCSYAYGWEDYESPAGKPYTFKEKDGKDGTIEIYFPKDHDPAKKAVPGVIMFHGGAWAGGTLSQFRYLCGYFASRGLVAATSNYRLAKGSTMPRRDKRICVISAKSAIRWYKQNAKKLGIDPKRIITGGGSAGGHVCLLATVNPDLNDPDDPKDIDTSVVAYLLFNPALGDKGTSPVFFARYITPDLAPATVFFGSKDRWKGGWVRPFQKTDSLGIKTVEYWQAEEQGHGFFNKPPWREITIAECDRFLKRLGLIEGEPTIEIPEEGKGLTLDAMTVRNKEIVKKVTTEEKAKTTEETNP